MRSTRVAQYPFIIIVFALLALTIGAVPQARAPIGPPGGCTCSLSSVPAYGQEGTTISLVLTVSVSILTTTTYQFRFNVRDPAAATYQSQLMNHTTTPGQTEFTIILNYPGQYIAGSNSLLGRYFASVDQFMPSPGTNVANSTFILGVTDSSSYERTQTINVQGTRYNATEPVTVTIRTQTSSTTVYSQTILAGSNGIVTASWKIPRNATIDNYIVSLTGITTHKNPPDTQTVSVRVATMSISGIQSKKTSYQRTDAMEFSFQPSYPDGSIPSTGVGLLLLTGPGGKGVTLTATYNSTTQTFNTTYLTTITNQTGTWTASLGTHGYSDAFGNTGPGIVLTNSPQLLTATISIVVSTNTNVAVGQQLRFNVTGTYPDGTSVQTGTLRSYLIYSGTPGINDTVPTVYDSGLRGWIGTYTARQGDVGGLWSLDISLSDSSTPSNSGSATRAITIQNGNSSNNSASFPLFYFGIIAAIIAGLLIAMIMVFKKRRVGHASLKIDLEAVHSEAGRIESQEFFKTIKEQVDKEKGQ